MTMSVDIIETMLSLGRPKTPVILLSMSNASLRTHNGCKLAMPNFEASSPVMNGRTAEPACPMPAM